MDEEQDTKVPREKDLARKICMGEGEQFKNQRCPNFDVLTKECRLLRDNPLAVLYKQERCLPEWEFQYRAYKIIDKYPKPLRGEMVDLAKYVSGWRDDKGYHKGILDRRVDIPTISRMYGLINLSLRREIERIFKQKRLVPPKKKCGTCVHRGPRKSRVCQLESFPSKIGGRPFHNRYFGTERKWDDAPCDGYVAMVNQFNSFLDEESPIDGGIMRSDSALWLGARTWKEQLEHIHAIWSVPVMFKAIRRCAVNARPNSKAYKIFERWYEENDFIFNHLKEHRGSYEQAKSHFLDERIGDHEKKRKAYSKKMERGADDLGKCLSGKERCQELSAPGGEGK